MKDFTLTVTFDSNIPAGNPSPPIYNPVGLDSLSLGVFSNPKSIHLEDFSDNETPYSYDMLIILGNIPEIANSNELVDYIMYKKRMGIKCELYPVQYIGITPDTIKSFIKHKWENSNIRYVLFIGDTNYIPMCTLPSFVEERMNDGYTLESDYWYGCIQDNSEENATVCVGRFPVSSLQEFKNIINKIILYETSYKENSNKHLLIANRDDICINVCNSIVTESVHFHYPALFVPDYGLPYQLGGTGATNQSVINHINSGVNIVSYIGHGHETFWGNDSGWNSLYECFNYQCIQYLNPSQQPIVLSIACRTGRLNESCLMRDFLTPTNGAAFFYGATKDVYIYPANDLLRKIYQSIYTHKIYTIGDLLLHAQMSVPRSPQALDNKYSFVLGGDPSMEIWTSCESQKMIEDITNINNGLFIRANYPKVKASLLSDDGTHHTVKNISNTTCFFEDIDYNCTLSFRRHDFLPYTVHVDFENPKIQNTTISLDTYAFASPLTIGYNILPSFFPQGNVNVLPGVTFHIKNKEGVTIVNGFEVEPGGSLIID